MNWRRRQPHELDHELLWLLISCASFAAALIWLRLGLPRPVCLFHAVTHHACLTCGATRCLMAFMNGNFTPAFLWNPLAFLTIIGMFLFDLYAIIVLSFNLPRLCLCESRVIAGGIRIVALLALVANWIYLWEAGI